MSWSPRGTEKTSLFSQIKTFLEMESHEERIQEIISRVGLAGVTENNVRL